MLNYIFISLAMAPLVVGWFVLIFSVPLMMFGTAAVGATVAVRKVNHSFRVMFHDDVDVVSAVVVDDGSLLVSLSRWSGSGGIGEIFGRGAIRSMLLAADGFLPVGMNLRVTECYRSPKAELAFQDASMDEIRGLDSSVPTDILRVEQARLEVKYRNSGHATGGAIDVKLVDDLGVDLDMGSRLARKRAWNGKLSRSDGTGLVHSNREAMADALGQAGFIAYGPEWWHWHYGDRYWAASTGASAAIFGDVA